MADKLPKYNLATAQFTPVVFEGATYKPEQEDMSLLANSLAKLEERERTANEKISAMDVAFGDIRSKLHQDKDTLQWFNDFSNKYKDQVASYARLGDYGNAINAAVRLGGEAANDAELIGRLKTSKQYEDLDAAQRARINKGITQDTYNWWKKTHKYNHVNIYDDTGTVVVGAEEIDTPVPYDDIDFTKLAETAYRLITPDKAAKGSNTSVSSSHSVDGTGSSYSTASGSSRRVEKVRKEDILARMDELLPALPGGFSSVEQAFDVYVDKLKEMKESLNHMTPGTDEYKQQQQKIEKRELLMSNNGATITDYKEFCARMVTNELFARGLAYDWRSTETSSDRKNSSAVNTESGGSHGGRISGTQTGDYTDDNNNPPPKPPLGTGPSAIKKAIDAAENKANRTGTIISGYFK